MRVSLSGGMWRGRVLTVPRGPPVRPTRAQVRAALFNILGLQVTGARVLDLCAGTGALGLEALSRGAASVVFVDRSESCTEAIRKTLQTLTIPPSVKIEVVTQDALAAVRRLGGQGRMFDLIVCDPPYDGPLGRKSLQGVGVHAILAPAGVVTLEGCARTLQPTTVAGLNLTRVVRYGDTALSFYQRMTEDPA